MDSGRAFAASWLVVFALIPTPAPAGTTTTVVDVPTRGVTQRFLHVRPDAPKANLVVVPGGDGVYDIQNDGTILSGNGCSGVPRNRLAFAERGFALAFVDRASDGRVWQYSDVLEVIRYVKARDAAPIWLVGGSLSTVPVAGFAAAFQASEPIGTIFHAPREVSPQVSSIVGPTFVIYHLLDPLHDGAAFYRSLSAASVKEVVEMVGGSEVATCGGGLGYHTFQGLDVEFVAAVASFVDRHNSALIRSAAQPVLEYYHAAFDHYFVTGSADEITKLDDGIFAGWARTGHQFNAYPPGASGTVPTCRFFSTSFGLRSSHFYALLSECATVKANPNWQFEGEVFNVAPPGADGTCSSATTPLYRLYNDGQGGAPNHRYTIRPDVRTQMISLGWTPEGVGDGVIACVPIASPRASTPATTLR